MWSIEKEEVADDGCIDTMQYCPSMDKYCDNADYQGVRLYCRKTCNSCEENLQPALNDAVANATQANGIAALFDRNNSKIIAKKLDQIIAC